MNRLDQWGLSFRQQAREKGAAEVVESQGHLVGSHPDTREAPQGLSLSLVGNHLPAVEVTVAYLPPPSVASISAGPVTQSTVWEH